MFSCFCFVPNIPFRFRKIKFEENFLYGDEFEHCEIPHSALKLSHNIGKGAFGSVYLAVADGIGEKNNSGLVAVKKLKSTTGHDFDPDMMNQLHQLDVFYGDIDA